MPNGAFDSNDQGTVALYAKHNNGGQAVRGETHADHDAAIAAFNEGLGDGIYGTSKGQWAGSFDGNVRVNGSLDASKDSIVRGSLTVLGDVVLQNADCAEEFAVCSGSSVAAGTVMVLDDNNSIRHCTREYDKRVAGVISGAGTFRPGFVFDRQQSHEPRVGIALLGKVYCQVDADYCPINVGDLLTTSATPGHAMKATDQSRAFGAVLGKALRPLANGRGLIPVLVALQ